MKAVDLFTGSGSFSKQAKAIGWKVFSTDWKPFEGVDHICDILEFDVKDVPFIPDVIWASPDCTTWSIASCFHHWPKGGEPSKAALNGVAMVKKTLEIIRHFQTLNPNLKFFIENPRGLLRKHELMKDIPRKTVWYCQYGDKRAKPTDIWTNSDWIPREKCFNGNPNCHHESAPRGSKTGTQGIKGAYDRSKVPYDLIKEVLDTCETRIVRPFEYQYSVQPSLI